MAVSDIKNIVGPKGWIDDPADMQPYVTEWRDRYHGAALLYVAPESTEDVSAVVTVCAQNDIGIVPQGGNTGLCGGAIPDSNGSQIILSLRRMNGIRRCDPKSFSITVDAGCTLKQVQEAARQENRYFPLSLAAEGSCQIGGNLSTNAGGINVLRFGTARAQVLGLEVVLADGRILHGLRSLQKDTAGYDLKQLFIGAEGTLGIITAASLRLQPLPGQMQTALVAVESPSAAVELLAQLRESLGDSLHAFELFSGRALRFVLRHIPGTRNPLEDTYAWQVILASNSAAGNFESALMSCLENNLVQDTVIAKNNSEAEGIWKLRHTISEAQKSEGASLKHDVSVPVAKIGEFIEQAEARILALCPNARMVAFGHVGDGNVHLNVSQPVGIESQQFLSERELVANIVYELAAEFEGSFSAEHGIGRARRGYLARYRSAVELDTMKAIKAALDPNGIMNPGKVL